MFSPTLIAETPQFRVISYGNGTAYSLDRKAGGEVFVQGDEATSFREEWQSLENAYPDADRDYIFRDLFDQYS